MLTRGKETTKEQTWPPSDVVIQLGELEASMLGHKENRSFQATVSVLFAIFFKTLY